MRTLSGMMAALALMAAVAPAAANPWRHGGFQVQQQRPQHDRFQRNPQRDFRPPERQPERGGRDGRMTDQERRDLHRDLDRANRELYKDRR